ncbi:MAG: hypothetical protein AAB619_00995 [Patescibacteria group bacterium]
MPGWVQVVLLVVYLAVCTLGSLLVQRQCRRSGCDRRQTAATVIATATFLLFLLLYLVPDHFPTLGMPIDLGITLVVLDLLAFVAAIIATVWLDRRKDIAAFIEDSTPPES